MAEAPKSDSPPPPSSSSDSPPPSSPPPSSPPPPATSSPPPPPAASSPPPPSNDDGSSSPSPPPPPPPTNDDGNRNTFSPPPPPPPSSSKSGNSSPPPPHRSLQPPSSKGSPSKNDSSSSNGGHDSDSDNVVPIVVGVVVGVVVLFLLALLACLCTCRKKKKKRSPEHDYYPEQYRPKVSGDYYSPGNPQPHFNNNWQTAGNQHQYQVNLPPPPGTMAGGHGGWPSPAPPPPPSGTITSSSSEMSSNFSGPHGPALPPPHPSVALGFTKSNFSYEELALATNGFSQANLLGQGGFGYVHKGILPNGKEIAVKCLKAGSGQGDREFQAEVEIISRVHHRHLVSLVGYSIAGGQKLLVYEFVPNYTLEHHLHGKGQPVMDWSSRMKIALGSAKGLAYLHEDCHPKIIHRDIKASNILLDYNFEAKVADFGLAKLSSDTNTHVSTRVMGTFGYLAPEYAASGKLTEKSDVFSFGVMLLELITGRRPIDINSDMDDSLVDWARPLCERALEDGNYNQLADPLLEGNYDPQEMARIVACAGSSVRHSARRRPKMSQIVRALEGDISVEHMKDGMTTGQSAAFSSSDYDSSSYSNNMRQFRKTALGSTDYASSEFGQTSEYGLNPSSSSSEDNSGIVRRQL